MKQVRKGEINPARKKTNKRSRKNNGYGTSKLEGFFAENFLDKFGVEYQYQYEAKDIGRYYDFYIPKMNLLIEVDGDYYHANPLKYGENDKSPMQRKNCRVDGYKNKWAAKHKIPLLRIWENDIRNNPEKVKTLLSEIFGKQTKKQLIEENKKIRH